MYQIAKTIKKEVEISGVMIPVYLHWFVSYYVSSSGFPECGSAILNGVEVAWKDEFEDEILKMCFEHMIETRTEKVIPMFHLTQKALGI